MDQEYRPKDQQVFFFMTEIIDDQMGKWAVINVSSSIFFLILIQLIKINHGIASFFEKEKTLRAKRYETKDYHNRSTCDKNGKLNSYN